MELLEELIRRRQFQEALQQCEEGEMLSPSGYATPEIYVIMLGCYLAADQLEHSKFLWVRIPDSYKKDNPVLGDLWGAARALRQRDIAAFRQTLSEVVWPESFTTLIDVIWDCVTERRAALISKSYSAIRAEHVGALLGLSSEKAVEVSRKLGWGVDENTGVISPVKKHLEQIEVVKGKEILEHLSNYVSFLEN